MDRNITLFNSKIKTVDKGFNRFYLAVEKNDIAVHAGLLDFFLLLQEVRIASFTPEIRTAKGSTPAALEKAWNALRLN